jgi:DNA-binding NtrC family response regulator
LSKILLIYSDETLADYFSTVIKAFIDNDLLQVNSTAEALKLLTVKDHDIGLVLVDFNLQNSKDIINSIIKRDKALPCIITANEEDIQTAKITFKSQTLLDYFHYYDDTELLWNKVKKMVDLGTRGKAEKKYCRVNLNFFYSTKEVFCDV